MSIHILQSEYATNITQKILNDLIVPFIRTAFDIISILGGIALWILIIATILYIVEYKLMPFTGWARGFIIWNIINNYKALIIALITLYITTYTIAFMINYIQPGVIEQPHEIAMKFITQIFLSPFVKLYKLIIST